MNYKALICLTCGLLTATPTPSFSMRRAAKYTAYTAGACAVVAGLFALAIIARNIQDWPLIERLEKERDFQNAVSDGDAAGMRALLEDPSFVRGHDARFFENWIFIAFHSQHPEAIIPLLNHLRVVSRQTLELCASGMAAAGNLELLTRLLEHCQEADIPAVREAALIGAAQGGQDALVTWLLDNHTNIESISRGNYGTHEEGDTALMTAALHGNTTTVTLLLNRGANVNAQNAAGKTALMRAAQNGRLEVVTVLADWPGIDKAIMSHSQQTAVHLAQNADIVNAINA